MSTYPTERLTPLSLQETYFRESGVHRYSLADGTNIVGVSADTWRDFRTMIEEVSPEAPIVASPELITIAGMVFNDLINNQDLINDRLSELLEFSRTRAKTLFVIGTPLFVHSDRPRNSVLLIKNGEIVDATNKRSGATLEENFCFDLVAEEAPLLLPGTNTAVLICADLPTAVLYTDQDKSFLDRTLELSNRRHLMGKNVQLLPASATSLLVIACWSIGGSWIQEGQADEYYRMQLRNIVWRLTVATSIKEVVVVDRVPMSLTEKQRRITPQKPFNGILKNPLA
ncbi:MAG: hypothetical protein UW88_C0001G0067 [Candidatus Collierbacteria bacterium GW2011_GWD2_45_10]|nr:MAG: hypothetical protein UW31_C0010G0001 [Candidatus Collierbacteria bacterium GW2011_GWA2_44_13]KKT62641.1 MAG: hypothetical protein UW56_C0005G0077 [Candidatus Collierbacteria bacterium GW2011_GWD1_44_27]KKT89687.1 MAG: hypothetical protein UW88_C0001G0067 [Candidatus Collierbacteria bacterium GW2011_GWD2_45_10]